MSAEHVAVVEQGALSVLAPDVEFVQAGRTMRGIEEVRKGYLRSGAPSAERENLDVDFDPGVLDDLGEGRVGATNHQVFPLEGERRARLRAPCADRVHDPGRKNPSL